VEVFESALATDGDGNAEAERAPRRALDRYTGDLLEGCYDEWLIEVRSTSGTSTCPPWPDWPDAVGAR
jgi:hypothetical protein